MYAHVSTMCRVGQNHTYIEGWPEPYIDRYGVYTVFWQGIHHAYGHIRCVYTVVANPIYAVHTR